MHICIVYAKWIENYSHFFITKINDSKKHSKEKKKAKADDNFFFFLVVFPFNTD